LFTAEDHYAAGGIVDAVAVLTARNIIQRVLENTALVSEPVEVVEHDGRR
jgi:transketolase C-terminal domain/subunit